MQAAMQAGDETRAAKGCMAAEPIGAWKITCVSPDGKNSECTVDVSRDCQAWRATYEAESETRAPQDVTFENGELCFRVDGKFAGQTYNLTANGRPQGETLKGTVRWSYGWASGSFAFRGERVAEQVASTP
jgi:hypothetical protein